MSTTIQQLAVGMKTVRLRVFRFNPTVEAKPRYDDFVVPNTKGLTVLDALIQAKERQDHSLAIRFSCRMASCGSCGMKINGLPRLACYTQVSELDTDTVTVAPLDNLPIIKDLVSDLSDFFKHHRLVNPFLIRHDQAEQDRPTREYVQTPLEIERYLQFSYCIKCALCYAACPTVATDRQFPGPQALTQAFRYNVDNRDEGLSLRINAIDHPHGVWRCHFAGSCSRVCPKGVDPALGIQLLRKMALPIFGGSRPGPGAPVYQSSPAGAQA